MGSTTLVIGTGRRSGAAGATAPISASIAAVLVLCLSACSGSAPLQVPAAPIAAAWPGLPASAAENNAAQLRWQDYFTDPRLQALIGLALANNRDLRIAAAKVEQERAQYRSARAERLPQITAQGLETRSRTPSSLSTGASSQRYDLQATTMSYEFDFWGRVSALSESARASFLATEDARREVQLSLVADVASAYFRLLEKDELISLAQTTLDLRQKSLDIVTQGHDLGGADDDERQQALSALESARASLAQLGHERNVAANQLNFLVGQAADHLPPGQALAEEGPGVVLAPGLPSQVLLRRPDVMAAEQRLRAAHADIDAARAAFLPKLMLTAALGVASPALASLFSGGAWSYQPLLSLPLFDGGRTAAQADLAQARQVMAVAEYEKTLQTAFREVADQLSARASIDLQLQSALASQRAQAVRLHIAQGRYEAGMISYREVLESQRGLLGARQTTIELRSARLEAAAGLYKVLGGGAEVDAALAADPGASAPGSPSVAVAGALPGLSPEP
jgi:multidrug efflux system outer membrane protein